MLGGGDSCNAIAWVSKAMSGACVPKQTHPMMHQAEKPQFIHFAICLEKPLKWQIILLRLGWTRREF